MLVGILVSFELTISSIAILPSTIINLKNHEVI